MGNTLPGLFGSAALLCAHKPAQVIQNLGFFLLVLLVVKHCQSPSFISRVNLVLFSNPNRLHSAVATTAHDEPLLLEVLDLITCQPNLTSPGDPLPFRNVVCHCITLAWQQRSAKVGRRRVQRLVCSGCSWANKSVILFFVLCRSRRDRDPLGFRRGLRCWDRVIRRARVLLRRRHSLGLFLLPTLALALGFLLLFPLTPAPSLLL